MGVSVQASAGIGWPVVGKPVGVAVDEVPFREEKKTGKHMTGSRPDETCDKRKTRIQKMERRGSTDKRENRGKGARRWRGRERNEVEGEGTRARRTGR